jgi:hypothetical protein
MHGKEVTYWQKQKASMLADLERHGVRIRDFSKAMFGDGKCGSLARCRRLHVVID